MSENLRFKQLRIRKRMTQKQYAEALGVAQSLISQVERNERALSAKLAAAAISTFELPYDYFEESASPYSRLSLNFRTKSLKASTKDALIVEFFELERNAQQLLRRAPFVDLAVETAPRKATLPPDEIEKYAQATRRTLRIPSDVPVNNVTMSVERAGIGITYFPDYIETEDRVDGISTSVKTTDNYVIAITKQPANKGDRQRFTIAHELGHLVLHLLNRPDKEDVREEEANLFAGAFLLPADAISKELSPSLTLSGYSALKKKWGVSIQAIIRRSATLGIISKDKYTSLMIQVSSRGWRANEPVDVPLENLQLLDFLDTPPDNVVQLHQRFRK